MIYTEESWNPPEIPYKKEAVDLYLTAKEVADLFGMTVQAVHNLIKESGVKVSFKGKDTVIIYPKALNEMISFRKWKIKRKKGRRATHSVKGGVGKTSVVRALADKLSAYGFKTLLIDLDKQANATNSYGIDDEDSRILTMKDLFEAYQISPKKYDPRVAILELTDYLHLIPADVGLGNLDLSVTQSKANVGLLFKKLLSSIEDEYDWILFDMPCDFNSVTMAVHCYIDQCIIPVNIHKFSFKGVKLTMAHIEFVREQYGVTTSALLVANKVDGRSTDSYARIMKLKDQYATDVSDVVIPSCKPFEKAFDSDGNLWKSAKTRPVCGSIEDLVWDMAELGNWSQQIKTSKTTKKVAMEAIANV
ncbi:MAG: hypothetical protein EOP04_06315 [Proteobacteria bacterium]|nr:MAG: hypothetical protein EOP04_06315 [Pseudomonadota bacterium]